MTGPKLIFLGTGSAFPTQSYNACTVLCDGGMQMLIDTGGGNSILRRLTDCGVEAATLRHLFITHTHTDHILGAVWVIRAIINARIAGNREERLSLYGNADVLHAVDTICRLTLLEAHYRMFRELVLPVNVEAEPRQNIDGVDFTFFGVGSRNVRQTGFRATLSNRNVLVYLGDESITENNVAECRGADTVVCGAFCRHADADRFHPYEKHHHTVRDVAHMAAEAAIPRLVLVHCEDTDLIHRQDGYAGEAAAFGFGGLTAVPRDGEILWV